MLGVPPPWPSAAGAGLSFGLGVEGALGASMYPPPARASICGCPPVTRMVAHDGGVGDRSYGRVRGGFGIMGAMDDSELTEDEVNELLDARDAAAWDDDADEHDWQC